MLQTAAFAISQLVLNTRVAGTFDSLATFQSRPGDPGEQVDALGQVVLTGYTNVSGLVDIPCQFAPQSEGSPRQGDTLRTQEQWDTKTEFHLLLQGYYPAVQQRFLVVIDGATYEVMGVESDSQQTQTRCAIRRYSL